MSLKIIYSSIGATATVFSDVSLALKLNDISPLYNDYTGLSVDIARASGQPCASEK